MVEDHQDNGNAANGIYFPQTTRSWLGRFHIHVHVVPCAWPWFLLYHTLQYESIINTVAGAVLLTSVHQRVV
jgi:hypothetical protein